MNAHEEIYKDIFEAYFGEEPTQHKYILNARSLLELKYIDLHCFFKFIRYKFEQVIYAAKRDGNKVNIDLIWSINRFVDEYPNSSSDLADITPVEVPVTNFEPNNNGWMR